MSSLALRIYKADVAVSLVVDEDERLRAMVNIIGGGGEADKGEKKGGVERKVGWYIHYNLVMGPRNK